MYTHTHISYPLAPVPTTVPLNRPSINGGPCYGSLAQVRQSQVAHVPDLLTFTGLMGFLTLFNIVILGSVVWADTYTASLGEPTSTQEHHDAAYRAVQRLAHEILDWFRQHLIVGFRPSLQPDGKSTHKDSINPSTRIDPQHCTALVSETSSRCHSTTTTAAVKRRIQFEITTQKEVPLLSERHLMSHLESYPSLHPPAVRCWTDVDGYVWEPPQSSSYAWFFE